MAAGAVKGAEKSLAARFARSLLRATAAGKVIPGFAAREAAAGSLRTLGFCCILTGPLPLKVSVLRVSLILPWQR